MKTDKTIDEYGNTRYINEKGQLNREDGPALIYADGDELWCLNGEKHRIGGPALIHVKGDKFWYQNDKLHREDGAAIERIDGTKEWFLEGTPFFEEDFNFHTRGPTVSW